MLTEFLNLLASMVAGADWDDLSPRERYRLYAIIATFVILSAGLILGTAMILR